MQISKRSLTNMHFGYFGWPVIMHPSFHIQSDDKWLEQLEPLLWYFDCIYTWMCMQYSTLHTNYVNTYKNLFVTSSKWLANALERHSIAGDNHSKQLETSSAKRVGWGLIQRLLVVDWVYSSKGDGWEYMEFFFFSKTSQHSEELV